MSTERIERAIKAAARAGATTEEVFREAMKHVEPRVAVDGWCGLTIDPATLLMTGGVHEHGLSPGAIRKLLEIEYGGSDVISLASLARAKSPVGVLSVATRGELATSDRYVHVLEPSGYGDELRAAMRVNGTCWGALILFRHPEREPFDDEAVRLLEALSPAIADAIRHSFIASSVRSSSGDRAVVVLDADNRIASATPLASKIFEELVEIGPPDPHRVPQTVQAIVNDARTLGDDLARHARARKKSGDWITLRANALEDRRVVVVIEPSGPLEVASIVLQAYGLTRREGELVRLVLHGFDTEQIAEVLAISTYTVQDHLKSIFDKVGVSSRKELVARLFFAHYLPRMMDAVPPAFDGWFTR